MRKYFIWFSIAAIAFVAYTYGARVGRGRYRKIRASIDAVWNDPKVKRARKNALKRAEKAAQLATKRAKKIGR